MSVAEIAKSITRLTPEQQAVVMRFAAKLRRHNSPAHKRRLARIGREMDAGKISTTGQVEEATMRSVLGCARKSRSEKNSRRILTELRGYDRNEL